MDDIACKQCGAAIEVESVTWQGLEFCSDDCCEEYELALSNATEPDELALAEEDEPDLGADLGYRNGDEEEEDDLLDDDYAIKPEDF